MKLLGFLYGSLVYVYFLGTFLYAIGFVTGWFVPRSLYTPGDGTGSAWIFNVCLLGVFGVQHTIMARKEFKRWWTRIIPAAVERSTFVLITNVILTVMFFQWRPMTDVVWEVDSAFGRGALTALAAFGFVIVLVSTFLIDHFDLFGLRQVVNLLRGKEHRDPSFYTPALYKFTRHPLYVGFILAFWAAPTMTTGRLLFAAATTAHILFAIQLEERDLIHAFGDKYREYKKRVPMLVPTWRMMD